MTLVERLDLCEKLAYTADRLNMRVTQLIANALRDNGHPDNDFFYVSDEFLGESIDRYIRLNG